MARKIKKLDKHRQDLHAEIMMHVRALKLTTVEDYKHWCIKNGFSADIKKSVSQRQKEIEVFKLESAEQKLKKHKKESNLRFQIIKIYHNQYKNDYVDKEPLSEIAEGFRKSASPKLLYRTLLNLESKTNFLKDVRYVRGVIGLVNHFAKWIRPIEDWTPKTHNTERQFSSLVRHLVTKYDVPGFMDNAWYQGNVKQQRWFIHIGEGKNVRTARSLPIRLTKKMAYHFLQAPDSYTVQGALRWAQILALGGNRVIANAINGTKLVRNFKDEEFWLSVLRFFVSNPLLDVSHINPIVDYIWNQKYENRVEFVERGVAQEIGPAQPNFSMRGRTPESLLRQVDEWHRRLGRETRGGDLQWQKARIGDYKFVEGNAKRTNMRVWTIRELLSSKELIAEGRVQGHCVASYARSCFTGRSAIWAMDMKDSTGVSKMVTIEVNLQSKQVCQVRGKRNRLPRDREKDIIFRWAQKEGLTVAEHI